MVELMKRFRKVAFTINEFSKKMQSLNFDELAKIDKEKYLHMEITNKARASMTALYFFTQIPELYSFWGDFGKTNFMELTDTNFEAFVKHTEEIGKKLEGVTTAISNLEKK